MNPIVGKPHGLWEHFELDFGATIPPTGIRDCPGSPFVSESRPCPRNLFSRANDQRLSAIKLLITALSVYSLNKHYCRSRSGCATDELKG